MNQKSLELETPDRAQWRAKSRSPGARRLTLCRRTTTHARALKGGSVGSVIKKRRKKMRKHKKRKLLRRARHKRKR
jgi:hypothetical protein